MILNEHLEDVIDQQVDAMKSREDEQRRLRDEAQLKLDTIMGERMKLEDFLYKHQQRVKHMKKLEAEEHRRKAEDTPA